MNSKIGIIGGIALAVTVAFAAIAQDKPTRDTVLATIDGTDVTVGHVVALRGRLPEQYQSLTDEVLYPAILDQLIQQTVLMNAMKSQQDIRLELSLENELRAFLANEMIMRLNEQEITEEDLKAAFNERFDAVIPKQEFEASHILVETEAEALELVMELADGADFAELAKKESTGPSGPNGGSLGWFGKGAMVPSFEAAVLAMAVGDVSEPVQTQFGWHVIRLNEMRDIPVPTLDDVRTQLIAELQQARVEAAVQSLTEAADVTRSEQVIDPSIIRDVSLFAE